MPERIQLSRRKGFKLPENTVNVARPSKWGNPWKVIKDGQAWRTETDNGGYHGHFDTKADAAAMACIEYKEVYLPRLDVTDLRGKNLACWCPLDQPCHADVLLEVANATV